MPQPSSDEPELTWTALLAAWTGLSRASVAFPKDAEGDRWRQAVPMVIELQAATHALAELHRLPPDHRHAALDTAEALITSRAARLTDLWPDAPDEGVVEIILDAHSAAAAARAALTS